MRPKIVLINPYLTSTRANSIIEEPLGLACLAACLDKYDVTILDLFALGYNTVKKIDSLYRIGFSNEEEIIKKLIKMFRAACNGKNYYKKWFPELKDTGDFEAAFISELNKLVKK